MTKVIDTSSVSAFPKRPAIVPSIIPFSININTYIHVYVGVVKVHIYVWIGSDCRKGSSSTAHVHV